MLNVINHVVTCGHNSVNLCNIARYHHLAIETSPNDRLHQCYKDVIAMVFKSNSDFARARAVRCNITSKYVK